MGILSLFGSILLMAFLFLLFVIFAGLVSIRGLLSRKPSARQQAEQKPDRMARDFVQKKFDKDKAEDVEFEELP
ncbi:MAG: hypothetical protein J6Y77_00360 [Paludibacteraceae bacterium]|nr:hypothetical protein [Paludibacteraceae bacterium]